MARRTALVLGLALGLAVLLVLRGWRAPRGEEPAAAPAASVEGGVTLGPTALLDSPRGTRGTSRERAEAAPSAPTPEPESVPGEDEPERWVLEGRVVGAEPERWGDGELVLSWSSHEAPYLTRSRRVPLEGASFTVELDFLGHEPVDDPLRDREVTVLVEHPALRVERGAFAPGASSLRRGADGRLLRVSVVVLVARSGAELAGRVIDEEGRALRGAWVGMLAGPGSAAPDLELGHARSDERGVFALRAESGTPGLLLVDLEGYAPLARALHALEPGPHELGTLILTRGAAIEGRVEEAAAGCRIVARLDAVFRGGGGARPGSRALAWRGTLPMRARAEATTDDEGRFRFEGLAAEGYHLELARDPFGSGCTLPGAHGAEQAVRAPAAELVLGDRCAWLRFELVSAGRTLVDGAQVTALPSWGTCGVGKSLRATWRVRPGARQLFRAEARGHAPAEVEVVAPGPGERADVAVELAPLPGGRILLHVREASSGSPVQRIRYTCAPERISPFVLGVDWVMPSMPFGNSYAEDGRHLLGPFEAGSASLQVAGGAGPDGRDAYLLPARLEVDVPSSGERVHELALATGGRVCAALRSEDGTTAEAAFELRRPDGTVVLKRAGRAPCVLGHRMEIEGLDGLDAQDACGPVVPPGPYVLEIEHGDRRPGRLVVHVEAGRTTTIEQVLALR